MGVMIAAWIGFILLNPFFSKKNYRIYLALIAIVYSYIAYHVVFTDTMDIGRVTTSMQYWYRNGWTWFLINKTDIDPLSALYYYAIGLTGDNHLIPAISVLIIYGFSLGLIYRCSVFYNLSKRETNMLVFFFMSIFVFFYALSNIRIYMCFAIIAFFVYMELIEDKCHIIAWPFYIASIFFHYASFPFVLVRVLVYRYNKLTVKRILGLLVLFIGYTQAGTILSLIGANSGLLYTIQYKLNGYSTYSTFGMEYFIDSLLKVIPIFLAIVLFSYSSGLFNDRENKFIHYCLLCGMFFVCMINNYQFVLRTPSMFILLFVVILAIAYNKKYEMNVEWNSGALSFMNNHNIIMFMMICVSVFNIVFDSRYLIMRNMFYNF